MTAAADVLCASWSKKRLSTKDELGNVWNDSHEFDELMFLVNLQSWVEGFLLSACCCVWLYVPSSHDQQAI